MTAQHFSEIFYTVMISTQSNKLRMARYMDISLMTLYSYLRDGVPMSKQFLVMDKLEQYLFENLGGRNEIYENIHL